MKSILVDIGGSKTNIFITKNDSSTSFTIEKKINLSTPSNPEHLIQLLGENIEDEIESVSLSLPGKWTKAGTLEESVNLKTWIGYPLINNIKEKLHIKNVKWESDVICGALGEFSQILEKEESLLYINIGTGIGGSLIVNGKPFKQKDKLTLRLHKLVTTEDNEIYPSINLLSGNEIIKDTPYSSAKELFESYINGEVEAIDLISKAQIQLATLLINLYYLFSPDIIVLNGGLTYNFDILCQEAIDIANEELKDCVAIIPSKLQDLAPIYGAFYNLFI